MTDDGRCAMEQCAILYVKPPGRDDSRVGALRGLGFHVDECDELPGNEVFARYHAVIVRPAADWGLPMLGARLRAKRHFSRRILIALVPDAMPPRQQRELVMSGFDGTLPVSCGARQMAALVLRLLRPFPEYRCLLRSPTGRRKAA